MGAIGFASDYDGTLDLHRGAGIVASDREAVARFRADGGIFGLDTGRTRRGLLPKLEDKVAFDFAVLMSGALVVDGSGEVIWERRLPRDAMNELVKMCRLRALGLYLVGGNEYWTTSPITLARRSRAMINVVHTLDEIPDPVYGVAFRMLTQRGASCLAEQINQRFAGIFSAYQNVNSVDVAPAGCSKASGLEVVRHELGISCMGVIGDSFNDVPMLEVADVGYTFTSAPEAVREKADVLVPTVAVALRDYSERIK